MYDYVKCKSTISFILSKDNKFFYLVHILFHHIIILKVEYQVSNYEGSGSDSLSETHRVLLGEVITNKHNI